MTTIAPSAVTRLSPAELLADLKDDLGDPAALLLVQDLDGVCMELVRDPLKRSLDSGYVHRARQLDGQFSVLTNGEHEGRRGVNRLVEAALADSEQPSRQGLYLPGLAAGGVQFQDRFGAVSTPGVHPDELAFLENLPERLREGMRSWLPRLLPELKHDDLEALIEGAVHDNPLSPTLNLNGLFRHVEVQDPTRNRAVALQEEAFYQMQLLLAEAEQQGAGEFFLHIAPGVKNAAGQEQPVWASANGLGTTDVQFMLRGAVKEAGLLVLLNQHIARHHGIHPLGADFNVRNAPQGQAELLALACERIPAALMPRLVGVGDTITSRPGATPGEWLRGGSDRGFLSLLQALGTHFDRPNRVVLVDSSGSEVCRPCFAGGQLAGISDPQDPLHLDVLFPGGPRQYRSFFAELAETLASPQACPDGKG
jgi:glucosylglycerol 3-phosphatase